MDVHLREEKLPLLFLMHYGVCCATPGASSQEIMQEERVCCCCSRHKEWKHTKNLGFDAFYFITFLANINFSRKLSITDDVWYKAYF